MTLPRPDADPFSQPRPRRPVRRLVWALSRASMVLAVVALTATAAVLSPIGTQRIARATAEHELATLLDPGEAVLARVFAAQRRASDVWRLSHGVLVATNRRVLYLGAPPLTLLRPADVGPNELYLEVWPYDLAFTMRIDADATGTAVVLRTPTRTVAWRIDEADRALADSVRSIAERARLLEMEELERLRRTGMPTIRADRYTTHIVQRGESLTSIARRFDTSVDVLRQLNGLTGDALRAGQRLRVPEAVVDRDPFADTSAFSQPPGPPPLY